jgi:hypothetical protein
MERCPSSAKAAMHISAWRKDATWTWRTVPQQKQASSKFKEKSLHNP